MKTLSLKVNFCISLLSILLLSGNIYASSEKKNIKSILKKAIPLTALLLSGAADSVLAKPNSLRALSSTDQNDIGGDLAIVRTFTHGEVDKVIDSFDSWSHMTPCRTSGDQPFDINSRPSIILHFSGDLSKEGIIKDKLDEFVSEFDEGGERWHPCFAKLSYADSKMNKDEDIYKPKEQSFNLNWVNGPNQQFRDVANEMIERNWGDYEAFYLMEPDSIPIRSFWLDKIRHEMEEKKPFAIMGSEYKGDKWDAYPHLINDALKHHINGNAIYNTSNEVMQDLIKQLEEESNTKLKASPFDYRMGAIMLEGNSVEQIRNTTYKLSDEIANYAATKMLPQYFGNESVAHGVSLFENWPKFQPIGLVISDWGQGHIQKMLDSLVKGRQQFGQIVIMGPETSNITGIEKFRKQLNLKVVDRKNNHPSTDLCNAPIDTQHFMITNSYHIINSPFHLFTKRPVLGSIGFVPDVPFIDSSSKYCQSFPSCMNSTHHAREFNPDYNKHVESMRLVFNTELMSEFCEVFNENHQRNISIGNLTLYRPTADDYVSWVEDNDLDHRYSFNNMEKFGARDPFLRVYMPDVLNVLDTFNGTYNGTYNGTNSQCARSGCKSQCEFNCNCQWRPGFDTCSEIPNLLNTTVAECENDRKNVTSPICEGNGTCN
ncbi:hypothetical protein OAB57_00535 [Bacteriovoracaceae bacterium]|nr:hypothetical protein [Bacteriovoracaceae bacterium]